MTKPYINTIIKNNFVLLTGGPGAGKTSVLNELEKQGHVVVREVAREIIKSQRINGGNATHQGNRCVYLELMLKHSIIDFTQLLNNNKYCFFDRGIPDLYSYARRFCKMAIMEADQAVRDYRYNPRVFIFPPWEEIYHPDAERQQNFVEAVETYQAVKKAHQICGYELIEVPKVSIADRVTFILNNLNLNNS